MSTTLTKPEVGFQLKGGLYTLTALQLLSLDFIKLKSELAARLQQAPKFFQNAPVVIDLVKVNSVPKTIDFPLLLETLRDCALIPVGVRGGSPTQNESALEAGLPILPEAKNPRGSHAESTESASNSQDTIASPPAGVTETLLITQPVRSGQQIYAKSADLIIHAPVSVGAEILADGNIHVYGPLRGRALAGVHGDENARIYCQDLQAELLSIAGRYGMRDTLETNAWGKAAYVCLKEGSLKITPL